MTATATNKPKGYYVWPGIIIGILLATAVLDGLLYYFSHLSTNINIEEASYDKGLSYQKNIDQQKLALSLGISASAAMSSEGIATITLKSDKQDTQLPQTISLKAVRPSDSRLDFTGTLVASGNGNFSISAPIPTGLWLFTITFLSSSGPARIDLRSDL